MKLHKTYIELGEELHAMSLTISQCPVQGHPIDKIKTLVEELRDNVEMFNKTWLVGNG